MGQRNQKNKSTTRRIFLIDGDVILLFERGESVAQIMPKLQVIYGKQR